MPFLTAWRLCQVDASAFSDATLGECSGLKEGVRRRVRKSRQKEAAGAVDAVLMQIEWSERGLLKLSGCSMSVAEEPTRMDQGEACLKRNLLWGMEKLSSGDGDTLR